MASFGVYVAVLALCFNAAYGLQCYSCDSSKGMTCSYGLLSFSFSKMDCSQRSDSNIMNAIGNIIPSDCMKLVGVDHNGNEYIARGCTVSTGPVNSCDMMAKAIAFADSKDLKSLDCYTCNSDLCNSATRFGGAAVAVGLVLACFAFLF